MLSDLSYIASIVSALATVVLTIMAWDQLKKIRNQNDIQILIHLELEWNSDTMLIARRKCSQKYLESFKVGEEDGLKTKAILDPEFEATLQFVLDFFEKLAYFANGKGGLEYSAVKNMYRHYFTHYFRAACFVGYVNYTNTPLAGSYYEHCNSLFAKLKSTENAKEISTQELNAFFMVEQQLGNLRTT